MSQNVQTESAKNPLRQFRGWLDPTDLKAATQERLAKNGFGYTSCGGAKLDVRSDANPG